MKHRPLQFRSRARIVFYGLSCALFATGCWWGWLNHLDTLGLATSPMRERKTTLIAIHGLCAAPFIFFLGSLLVTHVRRAWHAHKNRVNGAIFASAMAVLAASGYALYYLSNEEWRNAVSACHLWLGVVLPTLVILHIWQGRRAVARSQSASVSQHSL